MDQIKVVIAELELVLAMLAVKPADAKRIELTLNQAIEDLRKATKAITGNDPGAGETRG